MYDWISISSNYEKQGLSLQKVMSNVSVDGQYINYHTGTKWLNGKIINEANKKALWVSANNDGVLNIKVCPPKFIKGNNVEEASLKETIGLFAELSNMVGYDLGNTSLVKSIDITHTAMTEFAPQSYYPYLCHQTGELRWTMNSTLYYGDKKAKQKKFYDKVRETKKTGGRQNIPSIYQGENMTRFEVGIGTNARISKVIGDRAMLGHLFSMECVEKLHAYWVNEYNIIPKATELETNFSREMKQKAVKDEIYRMLTADYGRLRLEELVEQASSMSAMSYSAKSKLKKQLLQPFEEGATKNDLIKELDGKILEFEPRWE